MLLDILRGFDLSNPLPAILELVQILIIVILALTLHEVAHGLAAKWMGDDTASRMGRLSLNPIHHLDPIGFLCMLVAGFGWAKPVPINARRFRNPKMGMAVSALAGPVMNLLLAFVAVVPMELLMVYQRSQAFASAPAFVVRLALVTFEFLVLFHYMNISLAVFNLIPIPPLDGSRVLFAVLPDKLYFGVMKYERIISVVIMVMLVMGWLDLPLSWITGNISFGMQQIIPINLLIHF